MTCDRARERISALLDGEPGPDAAPAADPAGDDELATHLAHCRACTAFEVQARALHRRTRLLPAPPMSDLTGRVLSAIEADAAVRRHRWWQWRATRAALALVAVLQLLFTVPLLLLGHDHEAPVHVAHELGAFAGAISLGLLLAAARPRLAAGMVPVLGTVAGLLLLTASTDLALGSTTLADEAPHLLDFAGFLLLWRVAKLVGGPDGRAGQWAEPSGVDAEPMPPAGSPGIAPAAGTSIPRRRAAGQ